MACSAVCFWTVGETRIPYFAFKAREKKQLLKISLQVLHNMNWSLLTQFQLFLHLNKSREKPSTTCVFLLQSDYYDQQHVDSSIQTGHVFVERLDH